MTSKTLEARTGETKFAATIQKAWKKARDIYLKESGLKEDSEEWKFINDTDDPKQIIGIITETWAKYNTSTSTTAESTKSVTSSSDTKKTGWKAGFNRVIGRKENVLVQPSAIQNQQSYVDERSSRIEKLSGKHSKGKAIATAGLGITNQLQTIAADSSDNLKTVVDTVLKFSDSLQHLADISAVVCFRSSYY